MPVRSESANMRPADGARLCVEFVDFNHEGDGVARTEGGFVLFVEGAMPGDQAEVEVTRVHSRHGEARLVRLLRPAPGRIAPPCPVAGRCGGCPLMHAAYPEQLRWKEERVRQALARIGGLDEVPVASIIGMEQPWAYRNKAQFPVTMEGGRPVVGFYRRRSHDVVPADPCLIQHPLAVEVARAVRELMEELELGAEAGGEPSGFLRHLVVRVSFSREEAMAILVTRERAFPAKEAFIAGLRRRVPAVASVVQNVKRETGRGVMGPVSVVLWGKSHLAERIGHREFLISPDSFFQVNPEQTRRLYDVVAELAGVRLGDSVWDIYCGAGTIGLYVAREGVALRGVELSPQAVQDARLNAARNGVGDACFEAGRAEEALARWVAQGERADVAILDPPRSGCDPRTLAAVAAAGPRRIVYVSCAPATLARDLARLRAHGYVTRKVQPVDMFPHTAHVEAVALLSPE